MLAQAALQRGTFDPVALPDPRDTPLPRRAGVAGRLLAAHALRELRAGTLAAVNGWLGPERIPDARPLTAASLDLVRLEYLYMHERSAVRAYAQGLFDARVQQHHARECGEAAVYRARIGVAAAVPNWLHAQSHLMLLWRWARAILDKDVSVLHGVAADLRQPGCAYESGMAVVDAAAAGDVAALSEAYRQLRAMAATSLLEQVASMMRLAHIPVPRRTRSAVAADGLTDTERKVCVLVVGTGCRVGRAVEARFETRMARGRW